MKLTIPKNTLAFLFFSFLGLLIATLGVYFLPSRFFNDTDIIVYDLYNEIGWKGSYPFTILFYKITGLKHLSFSLIGLIQFLIVIVLTYKIGVPKNFHKITTKNIVIYISFLLIGVFLCMPTKEFINYLLVALIVLLFIKKNFSVKTTVIITLLILTFFGYFFREYYMLIVLLTLIFYFISRVNIKNKKLATLFYGLLIAIGVSLSYGLIKGQFISQKTRESFNEFRKNDGENNSAIYSPVKTDTWYGESFGIVYGFFSVNLPFNGLKHITSPQILAFVIWQILLFIILFIRYERCLKQGISDNYDIWIFYIIFSFFIVQGVFEPDLGSAIRHKIGIFPFIYYGLYYNSFREKK
ncbi:hypothetical protein C7447_101506 [Tenacibaculum adriaticum]|uniref:Dolichyl-phosphate-mannose-protein mannosyltransferase n=1 Tax=Tenacibaculum adriaticum TaxID=413713 RepID=A0A5S5DZC2_9FLAO|nr:hypothetical protein [Tenacibaculum adriaticum]TYP99899.1 hypothetical protein C7447_101506 [Tenacibaculum adriaticum]